MSDNKYITIPNFLSVSRFLFLPILFIFVAREMNIAFLIGYIILGSTDFFDGKIARRFNQKTDIGKLYKDQYTNPQNNHTQIIQYIYIYIYKIPSGHPGSLTTMSRNQISQKTPLYLVGAAGKGPQLSPCVLPSNRQIIPVQGPK